MAAPMDKIEADVERTLGHWSHHVGFDEQSIRLGPNYHMPQNPDPRPPVRPQQMRPDYFTNRKVSNPEEKSNAFNIVHSGAGQSLLSAKNAASRNPNSPIRKNLIGTLPGAYKKDEHRAELISSGLQIL